MFSELFNFAYQYMDNMAFLFLAAVGLSVIFGMMGVINMAHGELMMIGAYITVFAYHGGIPAPIAILLAAIGAGIAGVVLERVVIRHFYKQLLSSLVVTWGISLILQQGFLLVFGPSVMNVPTPFGSLLVGDQSYGVYRLVLFAVALGLVVGVWALFNHTGFGTRARATMEDPTMADSLGINTRRIYALTFGLGSALGGVSGAMFALSSTISPFFGANYTPMAFITVVVGGAANLITGLVGSVALLAGVQTVVNNLVSVYIGYVAMIAVTLAVLLILPTGLSEYFERLKVKRPAVGRRASSLPEKE
jgi:branched-chain amino acid transport system permease protein